MLGERPQHLDALDAGHLHVQQQHVGHVVFQLVERGLAVGHADDGVALARELADEELAEIPLVVGNEHAERRRHGSASPGPLTGRITRNTAPAPGRDATSTRPP